VHHQPGDVLWFGGDGPRALSPDRAQAPLGARGGRYLETARAVAMLHRPVVPEREAGSALLACDHAGPQERRIRCFLSRERGSMVIAGAAVSCGGRES
jgi:hypothetical protein